MALAFGSRPVVQKEREILLFESVSFIVWLC